MNIVPAITPATREDIPVVEGILLEAVRWLEETGKPLWSPEAVTWEALSEDYTIEEFCVARLNGEPAACMALTVRDPEVWPEDPPGEALYLHKLAVRRSAAGKGLPRAMIAFAREECRRRGIPFLRLDCHRPRKSLCALYEGEGFRFVEEKFLFGFYEAALYEYEL